MDLITVAAVNGERVEMTVTIPDAMAATLGQGDAEGRIRLLMQRETNRIAEIVTVAQKDATEARRVEAETRKRAASGDRGPDQIAFAGSKRQAIAVEPETEERHAE